MNETLFCFVHFVGGRWRPIHLRISLLSHKRFPPLPSFEAAARGRWADLAPRKRPFLLFFQAVCMRNFQTNGATDTPLPRCVCFKRDNGFTFTLALRVRRRADCGRGRPRRMGRDRRRRKEREREKEGSIEEKKC